MFPLNILTQATLMVLTTGSTPVCQIPKPAEISVVPSTQDVKYDISKTAAEVQGQEINTINPYGHGQETHTNGFMSANISMKPSVKLDYKGVFNNQGVCIWYDKVEIKLSVDPTIVIPKEVAADPCMFKAVRTHELKHVRVDRKIVNKYAHTMGRKVFDGLKQRGFIAGPFKTDGAQAAAERMQKTVTQLLELEYKKMEIERAEKQQAIDSLEEYQSVSAKCPDYKSKL